MRESKPLAKNILHFAVGFVGWLGVAGLAFLAVMFLPKMFGMRIEGPQETSHLGFVALLLLALTIWTAYITFRERLVSLGVGILVAAVPCLAYYSFIVLAFSRG